MPVRRPPVPEKKERLNLYLSPRLLTRVQAAGMLLGIPSDSATVRHLLECALDGRAYAEPMREREAVPA